jgi:hypothetical protein
MRVTIHFNDGTIAAEGSGRRGSKGPEYIFSGDDICKVDPPNKNKKKHRGRICRLTGTYRMYGHTVKAGAIFLDTGRFGYVDAGDLIPAPPEEVSQQPHS